MARSLGKVCSEDVEEKECSRSGPNYECNSTRKSQTWEPDKDLIASRAQRQEEVGAAGGAVKKSEPAVTI